MSESVWLVLASLLSLGGMVWLALAMAVHREQVLPGSADLSAAMCRLLRGLGGCALAFSAMACLSADRPSMAILVWVMLCAGSALTVALTLAWRPALLRVFWPLRS